MTVSFVGSASNATATTAAVLALPGAAAAGDLCIVVLSGTSDTPSMVTSGFTLLESPAPAGNPARTFHKYLSSGDIATGSITVSNDGGSFNRAVNAMIVLRDAVIVASSGPDHGTATPNAVETPTIPAWGAAVGIDIYRSGVTDGTGSAWPSPYASAVSQTSSKTDVDVGYWINATGEDGAAPSGNRTYSGSMSGWAVSVLTLAPLTPFATPAQLRAAVLALDPIAYYPCDDPAGSTQIRDHSIFRHHAGPLAGAYTLDVANDPTGSGKSIAAATTGSAVHTLADQELHLVATESHSFHHFLKPTNHVDFNQQAFQVRSGVSDFVYMAFARAADTAMYLGGGNGSGLERFNPSNSGLIENGAWGGVGYTRDYAASGAARVFKNGKLFQGPTNKVGAYTPTLIQMLGNGVSNGLNGNVAHAVWFDRKLSDAEMLTLVEGIAPPVPGPIEYVASGAVVAGASNAAVPYPDDDARPLASGDIVLLWAATKDASETPVTPDGFALVGGTLTGGAGVGGEDSSSHSARLFYRIATGSESGTVTVDTTPNGLNNVTIGGMVAYRPPPGFVFELAYTSGVQDASSAAWSVTATGGLDLAPDDLVVAFSSIGVRAMTMHTQRLTASGITFTQPHRSMLGVTNVGNNLCLSASDHLVGSGSGSPVPTFTATCFKSGGAGANLRGPTMMLRLRLVDAAEPMTGGWGFG